MAKGKGGSGKSYTSKGENRNVSGSTRKLMRSARTNADKMSDIQAAWLKGKNPWMTITNPNKEETNKPFIKVRMNDLMRGTAKDVKKRMWITK